jgi:hypothetical protein
MPLKEIWEEKGLHWKFSGDVTGDEILRALLRRDMDCRFRGMRYLIVDFGKIDAYLVSEDETLKVAEYDAELEGLAPGLRVAIVSERDDVFQSTDVYNDENVETSWKIKIFSELTAARAWAMQSSRVPESGE